MSARDSAGVEVSVYSTDSVVASRSMRTWYPLTSVSARARTRIGWARTSSSVICPLSRS